MNTATDGNGGTPNEPMSESSTPADDPSNGSSDLTNGEQEQRGDIDELKARIKSVDVAEQMKVKRPPIIDFQVIYPRCKMNFKEMNKFLDASPKTPLDFENTKALCEIFVKLFSNIVLIHCWFKDKEVLKNRRLQSLHSHFEKFVFETDKKKFNESKQIFSQDLSYFKKQCKDFMIDMNNEVEHYKKCMKQYFTHFEANFSSPSCSLMLTKCCESLPMELDTLLKSISELQTCSAYWHFNDLAIHSVLTLGNISDILSQILFLCETHCDGHTIRIGGVIHLLSRCERLHYINSGRTEFVKTLDELVKVSPGVIPEEIIPQIKRDSSMFADVRADLQKKFTTQASQTEFVMNCKQLFSSFIKNGMEMIQKHLTTTKSDDQLCSFKSSFDEILNQSRIAIKYEQFNILDDILKKDHSSSILNFDLSVFSEFQEVHLPYLEQLLLQTKVEDATLMNHVDNLVQILRHLCAIVNHRNDITVMKSLQILVKIYRNVHLGTDTVEYEVEVRNHIKVISNYLRTAIDEFNFKEENAFYKAIFPQYLLTPKQLIIMNFVIEVEDKRRIGVEIYFRSASPPRPATLHNATIVNEESQYFICQCRVLIPREYCKKLYYRYTIGDSTEMLTTSDSGQYEDVQHCYRVLEIYTGKDVETYDSLLHERTPKGGFGAMIMFWKKTYEVPDRSGEMKLSIQCHLEKERKSLINCDVHSDLDVFTIHSKLGKVYAYMKDAQISDFKSNKTQKFYQESSTKEYFDFVMNILDELKKSSNPLRVISALVLVHFLVDQNLWLNKYMAQLLSDIASICSPTNEYYTECNIVKEKLNKSRSHVLDSLKQLWDSCLEKTFKWKLNVDMMNLLAFILYFKVSSVTVCSTLTHKILFELCNETQKFLPKVYPLELRELMAISQEVSLIKSDIALQFMVTHACPNLSYCDLLENDAVILPVILVTIENNINQRKIQLGYLHKLCDYLLKKLEQNLLFSSYNDPNGDSVLNIMNGLIQVLKPLDIHVEKILNSLINLYIHFKSFEVEKLEPFLKWWSSNTYGEQMPTKWKKKLQDEQKYWDGLVELSSNVKWITFIKRMICSRYNQINTDSKLEALVILEKEGEASITFKTCCNKVQPIVRNMAIDNEPINEKRMKTFQDSSTLQIFICEQLDIKFPDAQVDCLSLVSWNYWPIVMSVIRNSSHADSGRWNAFSSIVKKLLSETFPLSLKNGDFTIPEVEQISAKWQVYVSQLFNMLSLEKSEKASREALRKNLQNVAVFRAFLIISKKFCSTAFGQNQMPSFLMSFAEELDSLGNDYFNQKIRTLCSEVDDSDSVAFPCCSSLGNKLVKILIPYAIFSSNVCNNDIFQQFWKERVHSTEVSNQDEIVTKLWFPMMNSFRTLLSDLENEEITLSRAKTMFGARQISENKSNIQKLSNGLRISNNMLSWTSFASHFKSCQDIEVVISKQCSENLKPQPWIESIAQKIHEWSEVNKLSSIADRICHIIRELNVKLKIHDKVNLDLFTSQKNQLDSMELKKLGDDLQNMKTFLKNIKSKFKSTDATLTCITTFCEASQLWTWIREKSKSLHEMEKIIDVAVSAVADEGHEFQDRLADLRTLCNKFSAILYRLPVGEEVSMEVFVECICRTAEKLGAPSKYSQLIESCCNNFGWLEKQADMQGSVEKGAVKELEDINNHGVYTIELSPDSGNYEVHLRVTEGDLIKHWDLDKLQELESKLVLITRETAGWVNAKETFQSVLQQVTKISDTVQNMKKYGYKKCKYMKKNFEFFCSQYMSEVDCGKLKEVGDDLESELCYWINNVWECRNKYYHLNFYTNQQLIVLREELEKLQKDKHANLETQFFNLLYSVTGEYVKSQFSVYRTISKIKDNLEVEENCDTISDSNDVEPTEYPTHSFSEVSINVESSPVNDSSISAFETAIQELSEEERTIYDELVSPYRHGFEAELAHAAVQEKGNVSIHVAVAWCNKKQLDDEFMESLENKWGLMEKGYEDDDYQVTETSSIFSKSLSVDAMENHGDLSDIGKFFLPSTYAIRPKMPDDITSSVTLEKLGSFLDCISHKSQEASNEKPRLFPKFFTVGVPNLLIVPADTIFMAILQIYSMDEEKPLPCYDEVLLCSLETTLEEVAVFLLRAINDPKRNRIYCLVHCEKLKYIVAQKTMELITMLGQGSPDYRLVIVCSSEGEQKSLPVSRLQKYRCKLPSIDPESIKRYVQCHLQSHLRNEDNGYASYVDLDERKFRVRLVSSTVSGVGKSLFVRRRKEELVKHLKDLKIIGTPKSKAKAVITVPLHGPVVNADEVLSMLLKEASNLETSLIHLDITQNVIRYIDDILFSLVILQALSDSEGCVWRCLPSQYYLIELLIPSDKHYLSKYSEVKRVLSLLNLLPCVTCTEPQQILSSQLDETKVGIDEVEMRTPMYQRVYQYLTRIDNMQDLESFKYTGTMEGDERGCLQTVMKHCGIKDPTWKEIRHFVWFLNVQLSACELSNIVARVPGLKSFVTHFMKEMSRDFATSFINGSDDGSTLQSHQVNQSWEKSMHPYLFFNKNRTSVTHVGMHLTKTNRRQIQLQDDYKKENIPVKASPEVLMFLEKDLKMPVWNTSFFRVQEPEDSTALFQRLADFLNIKDIVNSPDSTYVLTCDNLTKIMGIQMRFRCRIPVVLMGETGCGKTHLIRYMCKCAAYNEPNAQNMFILKVHGGTTESEVIDCIETAKNQALKNRKLGIETIVFFDEANTSDVISLIKEVMCDGRYRGKQVPPFLKFIAACNPYREHDDAMKKKLKSAGLGWSEFDTENVNEKLGEIPMRDLVYRVLELPSSMRALVYDFGSLSDKIEQQYTFEIVKSRVHKKITDVTIINDISVVLSNCQEFMRNLKDECSFVSLRDVERAAIVFLYFYETFVNIFMHEVKWPAKRKPDELCCAMALTISVCYHSRIENNQPRESFEKSVCQTFSSKTANFQIIKQPMFQKILKGFQKQLLHNMQIHENIAHNLALRENIFMMVVCIELRIPLFLVGKPGSSKSLAKSIISNSMLGEDSANDCMKQFKKVKLCTHQCSPLSTPASIIEVFRNAKIEQEREKNYDKFVSVVVLDEVGLAEASPHLPLKALHPLLEDGTEGSAKSTKDEPQLDGAFADNLCDRDKRVAFIGISNWALDPAKMNRGIMVTRGDPGITELEESARGICNSEGNDSELSKLFPSLASAYLAICEKQKRQFFGLRDFYSLIKMIFWMSSKAKVKLTKAQLLHAILRNFSGYNESEVSPVDEFTRNLKEYDFSSENGNIITFKSPSGHYLTVNEHDQLVWNEEVSIEAQFFDYVSTHPANQNKFQSLAKTNKYLSVDSSSNKLILSQNPTIMTINPHEDLCNKGFLQLMSKRGIIQLENENAFILASPNDPKTNPDCSPLGLITASLVTKDISWHGESRYLLFLTENYSALQTLKQYIINTTISTTGHDEYSLKRDPYVLFGSNFPKDNEYTQVCRNISEVRLCMETGRMVILLNLENLYESLYDVLNQYYMEAGGHRYVDLGLRTNRMKCRVHEEFKLILIAEKHKVYEDFPTPLVNRMEKHFVSSKTVLTKSQQELCSKLEKWVKIVASSSSCNTFRVEDVFVGYSSDTVAAVVLQASTQMAASNFNQKNFDHDILQVSKGLLIELATPDGVCRYLNNHPEDYEEIRKTYFIDQEHSSLSMLLDRLSHHRQGKIIQLTTHCPTLTQFDISTLTEQLGRKEIDHLHIEAFHTEQEFIDTVRVALKKGINSEHILLLECDSGHKKGNLISCCRYRIVDLLNDQELKLSQACIVLITHLPRKNPKSSFVSFQENPWKCIHVDELVTDLNSQGLTGLIFTNKSISRIFKSDAPLDESMEIDDSIHNSSCELSNVKPKSSANIFELLHEFIPEAIANSSTISHERIPVLQKIFPQNPSDEDFACKYVVTLMQKYLESVDDESKNWIVDVAANHKKLEETASFRKALVDKLKSIIAPAFSSVLSFIDEYNNLSLLGNGSVEQQETWKAIISSDQLCPDYIAEQKNYSGEKIMSCEFPFSWVVFNHCQQRCQLVMATKDADIQNLKSTLKDLKIVLNALSVSMAHHYINDFISLMYKCSNTRTNAGDLYNLLVGITKNMSTSETSIEGSLFDVIVSIHFNHAKYSQYFSWFIHLIQEVPSILKDIVSNHPDINDIKDAVSVAVGKALLSPYFDLKILNLADQEQTSVILKGWIEKLYQMQPMVESILKNCSTIMDKTRLNWKWICLKRMFMEHVVLKNEKEMLYILKRIETGSEDQDQLKRESPLDILTMYLFPIERELQRTKGKNSPATRESIHKSCWMLFEEAIELFCFDEEDDDRVLLQLINAAFLTSKSPPNISTKFIKFHPDKIAHLQMFVLKAICCLKSQNYMKYLVDILNSILSKPSSDWINYNESLFVITLHLFNCQSNLDVQNAMFDSGCKQFEKHRADLMSPSCLQAVSQIHFSCQLFAKMLYTKSPDHNDHSSKYFRDEITKEELNDEESFSGPFWYLMRMIAKKYGLATFNEVIEMQIFQADQDIFELADMWHYLEQGSIYNPIYNDLRTEVSELTSESSSISVKRQEWNLKQAVPLILAIYERVRQSFVCNMLPSKCINKKDVVEKFVKKCPLFSQNHIICKMVQEICRNTLANQLPQMKFNPDESHDNHLIRTLVVHTVAALTVFQKSKPVKLLADILIHPRNIKHLPTVYKPERTALTSHAYPECSKGHKHTCVMINQHCSICGTKVVKVETKNQKPQYSCSRSVLMSTLFDKSNKIIGFLSPVRYGIIRCILYSCLLWTQQEKQTFWDDICNEVKCVCEATGHSIDDITLMIHMVIREIVEYSQIPEIKLDGSLKIIEKITSVDDMCEWELQFDKLFIGPVFNKYSKKLKDMFDEMSDRDHNKLFSIFYMHEQSPNARIDSHLWQYHPTVTLDHFFQNNLHLALQDTHPALFFLLSEMNSLSATKFIEDIMYVLHVIINEVDSTACTRSHLEQSTVTDFIDHGLSSLAQHRDRFRQCFEHLCEAWELSKGSLYFKSCLDLDEKFMKMNLSENTEMSFFIPTMHGNGLVTIALLDHLIWTHNCALQKSRNFVETTLKRNWLVKAPEINVKDFTSSDSIDYQDILFQLVLKHSTYVFENGDPVIEYDLFRLEKDLICQCVLTKKMIVGHMDIPQVVWEMSSAELDLSILEQKIPQSELSSEAANSILSELKTVAQVSSLIDTLKITFKFLKDEDRHLSRHRKELKDYILELKLPAVHNFTNAIEYCRLENIKSLWKLLNIEKQKLYCRNQDIPFSSLIERGSLKQECISEEEAAMLAELLKNVTNLENLIKVLYDFICCGLKYQQPDSMMYEAISEFAKQWNYKVDKYKKIFGTKKVKHAIDVWKQIVLYQEKLMNKTIY